MLGNLIFWISAVLAVAMALTVVSSRKPMHAVVALAANLVMLGVLFLLLHAEFLAVIEVLVYAGAVMVLFLFVVALLLTGTRPPKEGRGENLPGQAPLSILLAGAVLALLLFGVAVKASLGSGAPVPASFGSILSFGQALFTSYLLPFELTALVLLAAVIGVVFLARERH